MSNDTPMQGVTFVRCKICGGEFDEGEWDADTRCPECESPKRADGKRRTPSPGAHPMKDNSTASGGSKQHDGSTRAGGCGAMAAGDVESADLGKRVFVARTAVLRMVGTAKSQRKHGGYADSGRRRNRGWHPHYGEKRWGDRQ